MRITFLAAISLLASSITATAEQPPRAKEPAVSSKNVCSLRVGDVVPVDDLDSVLAGIGRAPLTKDEFETTAQFESRKARAAASSTSFVLEALTKQEHAVYDADRATWLFYSFFLSGGNYNFYEEALAAAGLSRAGWAKSYILRATNSELGSYTASNAFGHQVTVRKLEATRIGIIEIAKGQPEPLDFMDDLKSIFQMPLTRRMPLEGLPDGLETEAFEVQMPISAARQAKGAFHFFLVGELVEPLRIDYTHAIIPEVDNPTDAVVNLTYLIADIQCGILADRDGKALKIFAMAAPF